MPMVNDKERKICPFQYFQGSEGLPEIQAGESAGPTWCAESECALWVTTGYTEGNLRLSCCAFKFIALRRL